MILFLHGINKRGNDLRLLDNYGLLQIAQQHRGYKYVVLAPQCPANTYWPDNRAQVLELINRVIKDLRIDSTRIYLTGFSMGGNGVWDLAANTEGTFAAAIPIAGWFDKDEVHKLSHIPIWAFHGKLDDIVPIIKSEIMINALRSRGDQPRFSSYPDLDHGHEIMRRVYTNHEMYEWLEKQRRITRGVK